MRNDSIDDTESDSWSTELNGEWLETLNPGIGRRDFLKTSSIAALGTLASSGGATAAASTGQKSRVTYYTNEKRQAAQNNIDRYDWARAEADDAIAAADAVLNQFTLDDLWNYLGSQDIPRAGFLASGTAGYYPWSSEWGPASPAAGVSYATKPGKQWKITNGEYTLPTNDFAAYRESGRNDEGKFDPSLADDSLLVNEEHPEMGEMWGVDDGTGWVDENGDLGEDGVRWVPVAWAHHWNVVYGFRSMLTPLFKAYLFTEEQQYARAATVILDRLADVYPEMQLQDTVYFEEGGYTELNGLPNPSHGGTGKGKQIGSIWESYWVKAILRSYDAIWPAIENDPELVAFLSEKAAAYPGLTEKDSATAIRTNIETGIVKQILPAFKNAQIRGNFGSHQKTLALSAVVQDTPDDYTGDAIDFLFKAGGLEFESTGEPFGNWYITGGDVLARMLSDFDRDGHANEGSVHYNSIVASGIQGTADVLNGYDAYDGADLYKNPVFKQIFQTQPQLTFLNEFVPRYGDTGGTGKPGFTDMIDPENLIRGYEAYGDNDLVQWLYLRNGKSTEGLRGDIFDKEPNSVREDLLAVLDAEGPLDLESTHLPGFGFTALRAGSTTDGTARGIWTYYGRNAYGPDEGYGTSHCHRDTLNLGLYAYGMSLAPDLGYPEETGDWPKRWNWTANTVSHNTVVVDEHRQDKQWVSTPKRYDHTDRIQLFDIDASNVYEEAETYRRTSAHISVDEGSSYTADFFRVDGGDDHHFSFHGAKVPVDEFRYDLRDGVTEFVVREGTGSVEATREDAYDGSWSTRVYDPSGDLHEWRGLAVDAGSTAVDVTVNINSAVTGYHEYWHHAHMVYLGQDADGRHVCAGIGDQGSDPAPRLGIYYPESNEWSDFDSIDAWEKGRWYRLSVSKSETAVDISLASPEDDSVHASGSYALTATTDTKIGIFGGIGKGQTGGLYFDGFTVNGSSIEFFNTEFVEQEGLTTAGLNLTAQNGGTYAGPDIPKPGHGEDSAYNREVGNGFNYLYNVERDDEPGSRFSVDWDLRDHWDVRDDNAKPLHLRLTMLAQCDDVAIANGDPPQRWGNPETFKYLIAHRSGSDLSSTFTSIIEPYEDERLVESVSRIPIESDDPTARAIKVKLTNGRIDYIASATDHETEHIVGDTFSFVGAFAVYSTTADGEHEQAYLNDGKLLIADGDQLIHQPLGRFKGVVDDFTRELTLDNELQVTITAGPGGHRNIEDAVGSWVHAEAVDMRNATYEIVGVESTGANTATLKIGERTTVKEFKDPTDPNGGYEYLIKENGQFVIPLHTIWTP
ncbi:Heparinase II/III-like protein [Halogranum amylolyticum]|uniref:Heparinase II/III-like protein n=1 Tax=Halogranum amylolyticum TaxID=660520 RepID=A0A1H8UHZ1_9EURY|nr:heparinase II/III family protein [Halogranum amylolyticum]SEP02657.1 Heparinase II/III-like protein [Halogranum amylolyticum]